MTPKHIPEVVEIWNQNAPFLTTDGKLHTVETLTGWYKGKYDIYHELYSLFQDDEIVGLCFIKEEDGITWVKMFALKKECQGKGLGSYFLKKLLPLLKNSIVRCEVKEENTVGFNFFRKCGFKQLYFDKENREYILEL